MEPRLNNVTREEQKIFIPASEVTAMPDSYTFTGIANTGSQDGLTSSLTPMMSGVAGNEFLSILNQREPRIADTAPPVASMEELLSNMHISGTDAYNENKMNTYYSGYSRSDLAHSSIWSDPAFMQSASTRNIAPVETFDVLINGVFKAHTFLSCLPQEIRSLITTIRPEVLFDSLQDIVKYRTKRRQRHTLYECAFCKNNGENEEYYTSHALKDYRGRVECPVLRAFRCPRCGATGDWAHTIKYCSVDPVSGGLASRRRMPPSSLLLNTAPGQVSTSSVPLMSSPASAPANPSVAWDRVWY